VFLSDYFTVSEQALKEKVNGEFNYIHILKNTAYLEQLCNNYGETYGLIIQDQAIIDRFLVEEKNAKPENKKIFVQLRSILGINQPKIDSQEDKEKLVKDEKLVEDEKLVKDVKQEKEIEYETLSVAGTKA
jgi:hypothetical protein